jgi:hypothetical protein
VRNEIQVPINEELFNAAIAELQAMDLMNEVPSDPGIFCFGV